MIRLPALGRQRRSPLDSPAGEAHLIEDGCPRGERSQDALDDLPVAARDVEPLPKEDGEDLHRNFWLTHIRIGFGVFLAETVVVIAYLSITPGGPHRTPLRLIALSWLLFATVNLALAKTVASRPWRSWFSVVWTVLSAFAVVGVADLDGGLRSPLLLLLFLPISFAGWAFTPRAAAACGVSSLSSLGMVALTSRDSSLSGHIGLLMFAVLAGSSVLSIAAARNRARRELHESELTKKIAELAATDGLTGCAVHRVFHQRLKEEVARSARHNRPLSLAMIDVDEFKKINDSYGHLIGDHVLAGIGGGLRTHSRISDLVARLGGDEFAVIMPEISPWMAASIVSRIRDEVVSRLEVPATLSIGISGLDLAAPSAEQLLDDADFALYEVKRGGRNSIAVRNVTSCLETEL